LQALLSGASFISSRKLIVQIDELGEVMSVLRENEQRVNPQLPGLLVLFEKVARASRS